MYKYALAFKIILNQGAGFILRLVVVIFSFSQNENHIKDYYYK